MKKFLLITVFWVIWFYGLWFAFNEFSYENAKTLANEYIRNSSVDENWKDKNPHLNWEWKYFYTDSDSPSYVEFKVSCDNNPSCWFIMVNFDWDDVSIPIASTSGNTPSEVLVAKNWDTDSSNSKLYYFNPFEQYVENEVSWNVSSIDPQDDFSDSSSWSLKANSLWKSQEKTKKNKLLKDKVLKAKDEAKKFKKSDEFKKLKKELKDKKQTNWKDDKVSFKYLDMAMADEWSSWASWYTPPNSSDTYIAWNSTISCSSRTPCYNQYKTTYNWKDAYSWCTPTAVAIIYWYYDRTFKDNTINYNDLVPWTATDVSELTPNNDIKNMIDSIKNYMWSYYKYHSDKNYYWTATLPSNFTKAINYAIEKWYRNSTWNYYSWETSTLFSKIKVEINSWRPVMVNSSEHSMVAYWYNSSSSLPVIRLNMWWGASNYVTWTNWVIYKYSNIDYNMNSLYYWNPLVKKPSISNIVTFIIKK